MPPPSGYQVPPPQPGAGPARPGTVSLASLLLHLLALLQFVSAGLAIATISYYDVDKITKIYEEEGASAEIAETSSQFAAVGLYVAAAFAVLFGVLYLILGIFVGKGKQWARITTWVVAGISLCCGIFGLAGTAASSALTGMSGEAAGYDVEAVTRRIAELVPSWLESAQLVLGIVAILANIAVIVLLLLPPSHPFFRKAEPEWTPPTYPAP